MDSERAPTCQRGSGPTEANGQTDSVPADVLKRLLATAGPAAPLLPLIGPLSEVFGSKLVPVPALVIALLGVPWVVRSGHQMYIQTLAFAENNFTYSVTIPERDEIHRHLLEWMSRQESWMKTKNFTVATVERSASDDQEYVKSVLGFKDEDGGGEDSSHKSTDFLERITNARPQFSLAVGKVRFMYKGTLFIVERSRRQVMSSRSQIPEEREEMKVSCFGRSREPIDRLLVEAKVMHYEAMTDRTMIYQARVPSSPYVTACWGRIAALERRSLDTVIIPKQKKDLAVNEIKQFLHPDCAKWYRSRGLPWRQGYLLHGPPGTGKTSFVQALAGYFGLPLYVVDLQHNKLSNKHLVELFRLLPVQSIILIEDIDVTGIQADGKGDNRKSMISEDLSYSGILNVTDGVGAQEGRILFMTTNRPELLDGALIRPGRVDFHIQLHNATQEQAAGLFCQVYQDSPLPKPISKAQPAEKGAKSPEEITRLSKEFAKKIPDGKCSPAEIQGFLLSRKKDPQRALDDVESWVKASVEQKESGSNVRTTQ